MTPDEARDRPVVWTHPEFSVMIQRIEFGELTPGKEPLFMIRTWNA